MCIRARANDRAAATHKDDPQPEEEARRSEGRSVGRSVGRKQRRTESSSDDRAAKKQCDQKIPILPAWPNGRVPPYGGNWRPAR